MFKILQNNSRRMIEKKNRIRVVNDLEAIEFHPPPGWIKSHSCVYYTRKKIYQLVMAAFFPGLVTLAKCVIPVTFFVLKGSSCIISRHCQRKVHLFVCRRQYYFHNLRMYIYIIQLYLQTVPRVVIVSRINDGKRSVHKCYKKSCNVYQLG